MSTLLAFFAVTAFGQQLALNSYSDSLSYSSMNKTEVPQLVTDAFAKQFPSTTNESWSAFPANGDTNEWYNDSYTTEASSSTETNSPNVATSSNKEANTNSNNEKYYVVEYTSEETDHKSVYSEKGDKIATHSELTQDVPKPVSDAIANGIYKTWEMSDESTEIFKDKQTDPMKVYKVEVASENEKHALYYQADGKLLKDRKVN